MSSLSVGASDYVPSWQRASAPARPPAPAPPPASKMTVTRTTTNATSSVTPLSAAHYAAPPQPPNGATQAHGLPPLANGNVSRTSSTSLQPQRSPSVAPGGGSPSLARHYPTRCSPLIAAIPSHFMNPNAAAFMPGRGIAGGAAGGLDILPTSTADMEAAKEHATPSRQPARSPAWQPSSKRAGSSSTTPVMQPLRLDGKSEKEIQAIAKHSALAVDAPVYLPVNRRTLHRVMVTKPSPLMLAQDPAKASIEMMLDDLWCLFYMPAHFGESIKEETYNPTLIFRIESIPTFWKVVNNVPKPTGMQLSTLHLFKDGIDPKWEDPANRNGGIVKVKVSAEQVDEAWELLLCKTIGDSWAPVVRNTINGVALKVRDRAYLLEVWVTKQTPELMRDLSELWCDTLGAAFAAGYYSHEAMQSKAAAASAAAAARQQKQHVQRKRW